MRAIILWIWLCAYLNCAGWMLSALHALNAAGYAAALAMFAAGAIIWWRRAGAPVTCPCQKLRRRFRRSFPLAFLILGAMAFLGGVIYAPSNYDALAYRLPRVLHWLDAGHWEWVHTIFDRLNNRSCGIEWVSAPVIALCHGLRLLFLINFISFLFLPGLVYSVFTRLGVRPRVAWHWMWLAPTGYCFLLQAGSIGNDLFGTVFVLAAVDLALRAGKDGGFTAFGTSVLAAGLITAAKTNNLPLLLPYGVALLPALKWALRRPVATVAVALLALGGSGLPTIYFNVHYAGDWSGAVLSNGNIKYAAVYRLGANTVSMVEQNLAPPVFPMAERWNAAVKSHIPAGLSGKLQVLIEPPGGWFPLTQMQTEEGAGWGFGLTALVGASLVAASLSGKKKRASTFSWPRLVRWASVVTLVALLTQSNVSAVGRLFSAYYLLPCTVILGMAGNEDLVRRLWWRAASGMVFAMAAVLLVISPARPLFPVGTMLAKIRPLEATHPLYERVDNVYATYRDRPTAFAGGIAELPPGLSVLGYLAYDMPETSLWLPFGARRIVQVCPEDTAAELKAKGATYILAEKEEFESRIQGPLAGWLSARNAVVAREISLRLRAGKPPLTWYLIQLN